MLLKTLLLVALLANLADALTTHSALSKGASEFGPGTLVLIALFGLTTGLALKVGLGTFFLYLLYRWDRPWLMLVITAAYGAFAISNTLVMQGR